jgi:hypothetical protein
MADGVVAIDVVETMETDLATYGLIEECCASISFETTAFECETIGYLIDPIVETGEFDFSEFPPELVPDVMFFSMGFAEGEPLPPDELFLPVEEVFLPVDEVALPVEEGVITSEDGGEPESHEDPAAPSPETSTAQTFAAFGRSRHSVAASIASAFGSFGFERDAQSDSGFLGGRRRGRR